MADLQNVVIEILEMTDRKGQYGLIKKIKGKDIQTNQTNTYTVYDKKKDGSISTAWSQLQTISLGDTVQVAYVEQKGTMQDGKPFTSRIVRNFDKDIGNGVKNAQARQTSQNPKSPRYGQNFASGEAIDWDNIAVGKCQTAFLAAYIQSGKSFQEAKLQVTPAKRLAELVVYGTQLTAKEELPTIQVEGDPTNGELNPMVNDEPPVEDYDGLASQVPF